MRRPAAVLIDLMVLGLQEGSHTLSVLAGPAEPAALQEKPSASKAQQEEVSSVSRSVISGQQPSVTQAFPAVS